MPINKLEKKSVNMSVPKNIYDEFHKEAESKEWSDSYLALKVFMIGWEVYKKQKTQKDK